MKMKEDKTRGSEPKKIMEKDSLETVEKNTVAKSTTNKKSKNNFQG